MHRRGMRYRVGNSVDELVRSDNHDSRPPEYCANSFRSIQQTRMNIKWCCLDHMYFICPKTSAVNLYRNVTYFGTEEYLLQFKRLLLSHLEMHKGGTNIHLADSVEFLEVMHKDRRYKLPRTNKTDIRC